MPVIKHGAGATTAFKNFKFSSLSSVTYTQGGSGAHDDVTASGAYTGTLARSYRVYS